MCDHADLTCVSSPESKRTDGSTQWFESYECKTCKESWKELKIKSDNITLESYLRHLKEVDHSPNSPCIKVWRPGKILGQYPDINTDYVECHICKRWSKQNHHWI